MKSVIPAKNLITLTPDYDYVRKDHRSYKGTPINIPEFNYVKSKCTKFSFDDYKIIKQDIANLEMSSDKTFLWILSRLNNKDDIRIPSWSGFQYLTSVTPSLCKINVGYIPAIPDSPTKYSGVSNIAEVLNADE